MPSSPSSSTLTKKVLQLKGKRVKLFLSPVMEFAEKELALVKKWASSPWETNLVHVPGLIPLKDDSALFALEMVMKLYPEAKSPLSIMVEEAEMDYTLIAENNHCGTRRQILSTEVMGARDRRSHEEGEEHDYGPHRPGQGVGARLR